MRNIKGQKYCSHPARPCCIVTKNLKICAAHLRSISTLEKSLALSGSNGREVCWDSSGQLLGLVNWDVSYLQTAEVWQLLGIVNTKLDRELKEIWPMASDQNVTTLDPSFLASQHRKGVKEPFLPLSAWPFVSSVFSGHFGCVLTTY